MELEPHFDIDNVLGTKSGRIKARLGLIQSGTYGEDDAMIVKEIAGPARTAAKLANTMRQNANVLFICIGCHIIP